MECKFKVGDKIAHVVMGNVYTVLHTPQDVKMKILDNWVRCYIYSGNGIFSRSAEEVEDGRFVRLEE